MLFNHAFICPGQQAELQPRHPPLAARTRARWSTVPGALPKRRRQPNKSPVQPKQFSDEELIRELNSSHLWLPDVDTDFGLDDVAAHVASRNQAQVVDFSQPGSGSSSRAQSQGRKASSDNAGTASADPQALSDIDPTSGQPLPEWVADLKQSGFDVMSRDGQLYLQRGTLPTKRPQQQQQPQHKTAQPAQQRPSLDAPAAAALGAAAAPPSRSPPPPTPAGRTGTGSVPPPPVLQVSDKSLSVRGDFDAAVWQEHIQALLDGRSPNRASDDEDVDAAAAAGAWYASPAQGTTASSSSSSSSRSSSPAAAQTASPSSSSQSGSAKASMTAASIQRVMLSCRHPREVTGLLQAVFPSWCDNGCWLVSQSVPGVVCGPTPAEAALALKGLALAARRARLNAVQTQSLAREACVLGLVEALRLTPPRTAPHQPPDLSRRLWSIAKAYWMQAGATTAAAAQQQLLLGAAGQGPQGQQLLGAAGAKGGPALGALLAQLQSHGGAVSKQQLAAAQALVQAMSDDQLRRTAVVSALWGMSAIGGALFFQQDMEALCQIAQAKFSRWQPRPSELSDVLWALAHARHATTLLTQLEACLMAAGGSPACSAAEAVTSIWAFAVLGYTPTQLLQQLNQHGWVVKPEAAAAGGRSSSTQQRAGSATAGGSASSSSSGSNGSSSGGGGGLSALRDSQLCTLAWSLACLQQVDGGVFRGVWCEVCQRGPSLAGDVRQAVQLAQAALAIQLEGSYEPDELVPGEGTQQLLSAVQRVFKQQGAALQAQKAHSSYQRSIAATLARLRVMQVMEDTSTGYAVDITIPSLRVAVEADGPSHFSRTQPTSGLKQLGATAMKRRHLQRLGWSVVNVSYSDWDKQTDEQLKVAFLKQQITEARKEAVAAGRTA